MPTRRIRRPSAGTASTARKRAAELELHLVGSSIRIASIVGCDADRIPDVDEVRSQGRREAGVRLVVVILGVDQHGHAGVARSVVERRDQAYRRVTAASFVEERRGRVGEWRWTTG